jgi:hypothetical protein
VRLEKLSLKKRINKNKRAKRVVKKVAKVLPRRRRNVTRSLRYRLPL